MSTVATKSTMSWMVEKSNLMPDYRYKGFHKSNYVEPSCAKPDADRVHYRHGLVQHFTEPGVEAKTEAGGLAYGSDKKYTLQSQSKRLSFKYYTRCMPFGSQYS